MKISYKVGMLFLLLFCSWEIHADWSQVINGYQWWYTVINGSAEIRRYVNIVYSAYSTMPNPSGEITVPSRIGGYEVTSIGDNTFEKEWNITGVTIPNSVKHIGYRAFYYCSGMKRVDFGNGVTNVGNDAFYKCTGLTSVTIPSNVKSIDPYAFQECSGLNNLTILNGVTNIGACAFNRCISLPSLIIPGSIRRIGNYAFSDCSGLMNLTIGYGVTSIGDNAFEKCSGLTGTLQIPSSVKSIGNAAFKGCSGLSGRLAIPIGVTSIGSAAFNGCSGLTGILTIPNGMASIAEFTFEGCSGLEEVKLGVNVSSIGSYAFSECTSVSNFSFSGPPPSVGSYAFRNVKSGACGYYPTEYRADWEAVIDINGYWKGLKMKEYTPPKLTLTAESADWWSGSITLRCTDGDKSGTAYLSLMYYDTAKGQWSEIERDELEIPLPVIETNEDGSEVLVTRITDKKFARRNNGLGILRYRVTDESERIAECATRDRHGLFVSVDDYANTNIIDLDGYASQEARVFKRAYETYGGASGFIDELTDGLSTKKGILTTLDGMVEKVKAGDIFLFYFAGHGGRGYVECNDSDKDVRTTVGKITAEDLRIQLEKFKQGVGIVAIINSCYSESMFIQQDDDDDNIGWIMAAREDQTAGGGRFGEIVCDEGWFKGLADKRGEYGQGNNNGYVTFWELAEYGFGWTTANPYYINNYGIRRTQQINFKTGLVLGNIVAGRVPPQDRANRMLSWSMWFSSVFEFSGGDIAAVEGRTAANGCRTVGECYALGINPEDPNDDLRITAFRKEDGQPVITVNHTTDGSGNSFADRIRTLGKKSLMDAEWVDVTDLDQSEYRFFKVSVKLDSGGDGGGNGGEINLDDFVIEQGVLQRYVGDAINVAIPGNVTSIANYGFAGNTNLVSVTIPGGVTNIGNYAFAHCSDLTNITFVGNAPSVGSNAFQGDSACAVYVIRGSSGWGVAIPGTWNGMRIEYSDSASGDDTSANDDRANAITLSGASGSRSFSTDDATVEDDEPIVLSCESALSSVWFKWTAPASGKVTFSTAGSDFDTVLGVYRCDTLAAVAFNDDTDDIASHCTFIAVEGQTYYVVVAGYNDSGMAVLSWDCNEDDGGGVNLDDFVIEQGVLQRYLGEAVNVVVPSCVTNIEETAFAGKTNLVSVTIPDGVMSIGDWAFYGCSGLLSVTIPDSVANVGDYAFGFCSELVTASLPASLEGRLADSVFYGCPEGLRIVYRSASTGTRSINVNFTDGNALDGVNCAEELVGAEGYAVPCRVWDNVVGTNSVNLVRVYQESCGDFAGAADVSLEIAGSRGYWNCQDLAQSNSLLYAYVDDIVGSACPTLTVSNIPFANCRVVIYASTDSQNANFGHYTINGVNVTGNGSTFGTEHWGDAGPWYSAQPLAQGVNYVVSPVIALGEGGVLSIVTHNAQGVNMVGSTRGTIAAIQIVETGDTPMSRTVTFDLGEHGSRIGGGELVQTVPEGAAAIAPQVVVTNGLTLIGWDADFSCVTNDLTITARYAANKYYGSRDSDEKPFNPVFAITEGFAGLSGGWNVLNEVLRLNMNGNSVSADGKTLAIGDTGLELGFSRPFINITVVVECENIAASDGMRGLFSVETAEYKNRVGVAVDAGGTISGYYNTVYANETSITPYSQGLTYGMKLPLDGKKTYLAFHYDRRRANSPGNGVSVYCISPGASTRCYYGFGLKFEIDNVVGVCVGGAYGSVYAPMTGMTIRSLAVFEGDIAGVVLNLGDGVVAVVPDYSVPSANE